MAAECARGEDVVHHEANIKAFIQSEDLGVGDLYICKSCVRWQSSYQDKAIRLEYKRVALHAVSRDGSSFAMPCLYCMVDGSVTAVTVAEATSGVSTAGRQVNVVEMTEEQIEEPESSSGAAAAAAASGDAKEGNGEEENGDDDEEAEEEEEEEETSEVRFAPEEPDHLDAMYSAMSQCQILHPDTDDEEDEHQLGDSDGLTTGITSMEGFFTNPEDVVHLTEEGRRVLEHLNAVTVAAPMETAADEAPEPGQFDDA